MTTAIRQQQEEIKHILLKWYFAKPTQDYYIFPQKETNFPVTVSRISSSFLLTNYTTYLGS